jgi:hypothetical protein
MWYQSSVVVVVVLVLALVQLDVLNRAQVQEHLHSVYGYPVRVTAAHMCFPDTLFSRIIRAGVVLSVSDKNYSRFQMHTDSIHRPETQYRLMSYGIPIQDIPSTSSGVIKTKYHLQWIKSRIALDEMRESGAPSDVVIHPGNDDVLFSPGGHKTRHYGNVTFRAVLEKYMDEYQSVGKERAALKMIRDKIIKQIEAGGGGFLTFDKKMNGWVPISDPVELDERITYSFYYHSRKMIAPPISQVSTSESVIFLRGNKRRKVEGKQLCCSDW